VLVLVIHQLTLIFSCTGSYGGTRSKPKNQGRLCFRGLKGAQCVNMVSKTPWGIIRRKHLSTRELVGIAPASIRPLSTIGLAQVQKLFKDASDCWLDRCSQGLVKTHITVTEVEQWSSIAESVDLGEHQVEVFVLCSRLEVVAAEVSIPQQPANCVAMVEDFQNERFHRSRSLLLFVGRLTNGFQITIFEGSPCW
jgi:hypothetical protein